MRQLCIAAQMELKGVRIFKIHLLISFFVLPFSYALVLVLANGGGEPAHLLSGLATASLVGAFTNMVALRISNLMQPEVLELYAVLPLRMERAAGGVIAAFSVLVLPQTVILLGAAWWLSDAVQPAWLILGALMSFFALASLGCFMGALVRNPFTAQGLFPLISWVLLLTAPLFYTLEGLPTAFRLVVLLNPVTHAVNLIRFGLGFTEVAALWISLAYLAILIFAVSLWVVPRLRKPQMLERFF